MKEMREIGEMGKLIQNQVPSKVIKGSAQHDRFYLRLQLGIRQQATFPEAPG